MTSKSMRAQVEHAAFLKEVELAASIVSTRATIPILANLLISAEGDQLRICSTNLIQTIATSCPAVIEVKGKCAVPARKLLEYLRLLPAGELHLELLANDSLKIESSSSLTKLRGMPARNFPVIPEPPPPSHTCDASAFRDLIKRTQYATDAPAEEGEASRNDCILLAGGPSLRMVATDGRRIAIATSSQPGIDHDLKISASAVKPLLKLIQSESTLHIAEDERAIYFSAGRTLSIAKTVRAFPNYQSLQLNYDQPGILLNSEAIGEAIQRAMLFVDRKTGCAALNVSKGKIRISAAAAEIGEAQEEIEAMTEGIELSIGLNAAYMQDALPAISGDFLLKLTDAQSPAIMKRVYDDHSELTYLIMPMRIQ